MKHTILSLKLLLTPIPAYLAGLLFLSGIMASGAYAEDCFIAGPYVLHVDQSSANIVWVTPSGTNPGEVHLQPADGGEKQRISAELSTPHFQRRDEDDPERLHEMDHLRQLARPDGLNPYSEYEYRVLCGDGISSRSGSFMTAPNPGETTPFEFVVVSDGHADSGRYDEVAPAVGEAKPDFVVHTGDLTGGRGPDWIRWLPYFSVARPYLESSVLVPVIGGHDARPNRNFRAFFAFNDPEGDPADEDEAGTWYNFRYGNLEFFLIDHTHDLKPQIEWVEKKLAESDAEWKIAAFHQSEANVGGRGNLLRRQYYDLARLFEKYGVDLVIYGHDHIYERKLPFGPEGVKPVHYISINSGGNFREVRPSPIVQGGIGQLVRMYAHFRVEGNRLVMEARAEYPDDKAGMVIDRLELIKDENGMYQEEIMNQAIDKDLALKISHIYTGNIDGDLRYSRRDINAEFADYPEDDKPVRMTLNVHRFPIGSELVIYEQDDPNGWRTEYQIIEITGNTVEFEVIAPEYFGTVVRSWSPDRGTSITEPVPEFRFNIRIDGRKFEPSVVRPTFGVSLVRE